MKKYIPNFVTILSLFCGCLGILEALKGNLENAKILMWVGALFDFLDGLVARILNATSSIGKQLDSMSDMVTFGVLPGMMMYKTLSEYFNPSSLYEAYLPLSAFIIPAFAALRLAKFNLDTTQSNSFKGLPTPAGAILIATISTLQLHTNLSYFTFVFFNPYILISVSIIISLLLVSNIRFIAFKMKGFGKLQNKLQYILIISSILLITIYKNDGILLSMSFYIFLSLFTQRDMKNNI